jgi:hypothetical protein
MNPTTTTDKKETYIKCKKCGTEIPANTHKRLTRCKCEAVWVDGCEDYIRIGGSKENYEQIQK